MAQPLAPLAPASAPPTRVVFTGHVDHGKSTLIGRLLHDTESLPHGKVEAVRASCARRGVPFEWAFVMDAFKAERDQNVTIDTAQVWFATAARRYVIIDAPGHREFLKNMVTGAAQADAAVLVVAADEGIRDQTRRHGQLLSLLGIQQVVVVINKMDVVGWDRRIHAALEAEARAWLQGLGLSPTAFVPVAARTGQNLARAGAESRPWYGGPTVTEALDAIRPHPRPIDEPLRLPVQDVYRFDERRIVAGRVEAGSVAVGDELRVLPGAKTARVVSLEGWPARPPERAEAGQCVGMVLDPPLFVERGQVFVHAHAPRDRPTPTVTSSLRARLFWMGARPLQVGRPVKLKLATAAVQATVRAVLRRVDAETLAEVTTEATADPTTEASGRIERDDVAEVWLDLAAPLAVDLARDVPELGRFVLVDGYDLAGGGLVLEALPLPGVSEQPAAPHAPRSGVSTGETGEIVWLDGASHASRPHGGGLTLDPHAPTWPSAVPRAAIPALARHLAAAGHRVVAVATPDTPPPPDATWRERTSTPPAGSPR